MTTADELGTEPQATVDACHHPMVIAAMARMASSGSWAQVLRGERLDSPLDLADAELLVAAGVLEERGRGYAVIRKESSLGDPEALARGMIAQLQRALHYARGGAAGWTGEDLDLVRNQGHGSAAAGDAIADGLIHFLPGAERGLRSGHGRFLDIGTGMGAISARMCEHFPGLTCVGLDVLPHVLDMARAELKAAGLGHRVEVRDQSIADIEEVEEFDLAWVPQPFIPREQFVPGLACVHRSLRRGGGIVLATLAPPDITDPMVAALSQHSGHVLGGGPIEIADSRALLSEAGFEDIRDFDYAGQVVLIAVRP